ncbi:unnamed protein product [Angiostrongylus costaricensis]|uniref:Uncharacterized protein n=1 Tax=Angiostrongylus costaricensis TaxID=334426 RepID=A0A0R3PPM8_ANGCS|nr:unnamed protein product [Angiostrongylus costaricensis]
MDTTEELAATNTTVANFVDRQKFVDVNRNEKKKDEDKVGSNDGNRMKSTTKTVIINRVNNSAVKKHER